MDSIQEQQIWQRVTQSGSMGPPLETLRAWMLSAQEAKGVYHALAQGAREKRLLLRLQDAEAENAACLRGMLVAAGAAVPRGNLGAAPVMPMKKALTIRLGHCREAYRNYAGCSADPEYGPVFQRMAQRQAEQMSLLLTVLASL